MEQNQNKTHLIMEIQVVSQETESGGANINVVFTALPERMPSDLLIEITKTVKIALENIPERVPEIMAPPMDIKVSDKPNEYDGSAS